MGRWNRNTQIGVYEKFVNGQSIGFVVAHCGGSLSIRGNCIFPTKDEALAVFNSIEANTKHRSERIEYKTVAKGKKRDPQGYNWC